MSLSSKSNTINALGIFGRLSSDQEKYFFELSQTYSEYPADSDALGIFNHLTFLLNNDEEVGEIGQYLDLLKKLKPFLPIKLKVKEVIIIDQMHVALSFDPNQTYAIRKLAEENFDQGIITTYYTKVVWYVPKEKQERLINELSNFEILEFYDLLLCANRTDEPNTIYSSLRF